MCNISVCVMLPWYSNFVPTCRMMSVTSPWQSQRSKLNLNKNKTNKLHTDNGTKMNSYRLCFFPRCQCSDGGGGVDQWKCQQRQWESWTWLLWASYRAGKRSLWQGVCVCVCIFLTSFSWNVCPHSPQTPRIPEHLMNECFHCECTLMCIVL